MLGETLVLLGLLILVFLYFTRRRQKKEPPLDKGFVPWLGHALAFRKDAAKFLSQMKETHGDIFTVCVAGQYVTLLLDPNSFDAVLTDTDNFTHNKRQLLQRIFSLQLPNIKPSAERKWMEQHFQGLSLSKLCSSTNRHIEDILINCRDSSPSEWRRDGLFSLCYSFLFRAGYLTLFERRDNTSLVYEEFRKFDSLLTKLARCSLKKAERQTAKLTREQLWELLSPKLTSRGSESGSWQLSYHRFLQDEGVDAEMQKRALLFQLWTTQCNAGPAAFWLLGFLLTHPEAMEALKSEISGLSHWDASLEQPLINSLEASCTPVFDSILSETLRLTAAVMISREVRQDKVLIMASGQEYHLRQGDKVCLFPYLSPQMDPVIHQEPQVFKYDRFLNDDMTVKDRFYKNGQRLKHYNMPWGAGSNVCTGKAFAVRAIKQFVLLFLTHFDLELCDPEAKLPPFNPNRYGFGILHPDGDLLVRSRAKDNAPSSVIL
ncbi:prostacyclin synthase [Brachionichthys hirsutus]|uniref:prostacyclin synthase n=1 Tax=Brachionichthys hirsutus TaxID=412623 RepID=UPI003605293F